MIIPDKPGPDREAAILEAVRAGNYEHEWAEIDSEARGNQATMFVSRDALKIDGVRVTVNAQTNQRIADLLGAYLNTTRTCDLAYEQAAVVVPPQLQTPDAHMSDWSRTIKHSSAVDAVVAGRGGL